MMVVLVLRFEEVANIGFLRSHLHNISFRLGQFNKEHLLQPELVQGGCEGVLQFIFEPFFNMHR